MSDDRLLPLPRTDAREAVLEAASRALHDFPDIPEVRFIWPKPNWFDRPPSRDDRPVAETTNTSWVKRVWLHLDNGQTIVLQVYDAGTRETFYVSERGQIFGKEPDAARRPEVTP